MENKLIAEFMDNETIFNTIHDATLYNIKEQGAVVYELSELKYHASWDWLMPVVQKCYKIDSHEAFNNLVDAVAILDIDTTYKAVIEFINYYNRENGSKV